MDEVKSGQQWLRFRVWVIERWRIVGRHGGGKNMQGGVGGWLGGQEGCCSLSVKSSGWGMGLLSKQTRRGHCKEPDHIKESRVCGLSNSVHTHTCTYAFVLLHL